MARAKTTGRPWAVVIRPHMGRLAVIFLLALLAGAASVFATLYLGQTIDVIAGALRGQFDPLNRMLSILGALYLASAVFGYLVSVMSNRVAFDVVYSLRVLAFEKLSRLRLKYYDGHAHGDILSRFTGDIDSISDALSLGLVSLFSGVVTVVLSLVLMLSLDVRLTAVILATTPLCFFAAYIVARLSKKTFTKQQQVVGQLSGTASETISNLRTVKALGREEERAAMFRALNEELRLTGTKAQFASAMVNPSTRVVDNLSYLLVGVAGGFWALGGGLSIGVISSFLIYSAQFAKPFNEISGIMSNLQTAYAALHRIEDLLNEAEEQPDAPDAIALTDIRGEVAFSDVAFSYDKARPLIEGLSLLAAPGALIAIVGPTGAGKTTLVNLLMRFYEVDAGQITVDGRDIRGIRRDEVRRAFGMVLQETWLKRGTIRENIAYGHPNATDEQIENAARLARADHFIRLMPGGYEATVEEDGANLSQGQRQLITIARVMLNDPRMLILDEATSSIDTLTEARVQRAFLELMKGRTSFVIAHRLKTIVSADRILVMDKGRIVETGTHRELLQKKGFYYSLYQSQFEPT